MERLPNSELSDPLRIMKCFGQLAIWQVQDWLIGIDDSIVELPDE